MKLVGGSEDVVMHPMWIPQIADPTTDPIPVTPTVVRHLATAAVAAINF